jgi:WD40 repeat protein
MIIPRCIFLTDIVHISGFPWIWPSEMGLVGSVLGVDVAARETCGDQHAWETGDEAPDSGCYCIVREADHVHAIRDALTGRRISRFNSDSKYRVSHICALDRSCAKAVFMCGTPSTDMILGWDILSNCELFAITDPQFYLVLTISLNNAGTRFVTASDYNNFGLYNADTGELLMRFGQESWRCQFNFDDSRIYATPGTGVSIWDADRGSNLLFLDRGIRSLWLLSVGNCSGVLAFNDVENIVICNDAGKELGSVGVSRFEVDCGAFGHNDDLFIASVTKIENRWHDEDPPFWLGRPDALSTLFVWNVQSMSCLHQIPLLASLNCISFCPHNHSVLVGHNSIQQVSLVTGQEISRQVEYGCDVVVIAVQPQQVILM